MFVDCGGTWQFIGPLYYSFEIVELPLPIRGKGHLRSTRRACVWNSLGLQEIRRTVSSEHLPAKIACTGCGVQVPPYFGIVMDVLFGSPQFFGV
jgi:hypothetical protein